MHVSAYWVPGWVIKDADADTRGVLLGQQVSQVIVGGVGNGYGSHGNSSQACRQFTPKYYADTKPQ
jgi:hypothetical protein